MRYRSPDQFELSWGGLSFTIEPRRINVRGSLADQLVADLVFGAVWSFALFLHDIPAFHAHAVLLGHRGIAIMGASGAGKSTAGTHLRDLGATLISDDILALDASGAAQPGAPWTRLVVPGATDTLHKVRVPAELVDGPVPITDVVVLDPRFDTTKRVSGAAAVDAILSHTYNPLIDAPAHRQLQFDAAVALAQGADVTGAAPRSLGARDLAQLFGMEPTP